MIKTEILNMGAKVQKKMDMCKFLHGKVTSYTVALLCYYTIL